MDLGVGLARLVVDAAERDLVAGSFALATSVAVDMVPHNGLQFADATPL
jgi:hypothetical protein